MKDRHSASIRWASFLLFTMIVAAASFAQFAGTGDFDLSWNTIDGGGGTSVGGSFELSGTIGQPDAGVMTGGVPGNEFQVVGGFWPGSDVLPGPNTCPADISPLPGGDGLVNANDLLAVINGWGACANPPAPCPPDITNDNVVNANDLLAVINAWGVCP